MDGLLKFLEDLISAGVPKSWIAVCMGIAGLGFMFYYMVKSITLLTSYFKQPTTSATKEELEKVKTTLLDDNKYILKILGDVDDRLKSIETSNDQVIEINRQLENELEKVSKLSDDIHDLQEEELKSSSVIQRDLTILVSDSKAQYSEITRQVQALQKDLASLHGTIIGLNTQRSRLK
jgi:phage shock protein A